MSLCQAGLLLQLTSNSGFLDRRMLECAASNKLPYENDDISDECSAHSPSHFSADERTSVANNEG